MEDDRFNTPYVFTHPRVLKTIDALKDYAANSAHIKSANIWASQHDRKGRVEVYEANFRFQNGIARETAKRIGREIEPAYRREGVTLGHTFQADDDNRTYWHLIQNLIVYGAPMSLYEDSEGMTFKVRKVFDDFNSLFKKYALRVG